MINLGFVDGELATITTTESWFGSYYLNGKYITSVAEGAGTYTVFQESAPGQQHWQTTIDTNIFQPIFSIGELTAFAPFTAMALAPSNAAATPEASTWVMLTLGLACLAYIAKRRRYAQAI